MKGQFTLQGAGFLYTDCAEIIEDGTNFTYRKGWGFGYGSYTDVESKGQTVSVRKCA